MKKIDLRHKIGSHFLKSFIESLGEKEYDLQDILDQATDYYNHHDLDEDVQKYTGEDTLNEVINEFPDEIQEIEDFINEALMEAIQERVEQNYHYVWDTPKEKIGEYDFDEEDVDYIKSLPREDYPLENTDDETLQKILHSWEEEWMSETVNANNVITSMLNDYIYEWLEDTDDQEKFLIDLLDSHLEETVEMILNATTLKSIFEEGL